ncbi:translation initiation factor [Porphyromonas sp. COT-239 OH1446]|uniref:translation initiation factor n=1 Tax=Porphyromonas sp. COT-239 OH1446 TaxID=1515613 RepID=UPI00052BDFC7|nr:translation initiation factor [Porphyromonas sp. COT-239 OH1446]KGN70204.1 hypothetical protein HQ37_03940 [Porphyromonas sp. COT-239 OH1446]
MADWKKRLGVLYSTNPDFDYERTDSSQSIETLPEERQELRISISRRHRAGKEVSLITGFVGSEGSLEELGKLLKQRCGVGGAVKQGEIIIQGDQRDKLLEILLSLGYKRTRKA